MADDSKKELVVGEKQPPPAVLDAKPEKDDNRTRFWPEYPGIHFIGRRG